MRAIKRRRDEETKRRSAHAHTLVCSCPTTLAPSPYARRAFSLVELVIVVGIIVLLVGLTLAVLTTLTRGSESRRTEDALKLIDAAYQEWKTLAERDLSYGIGPNYEIQQDVAAGGADDHEATDFLLGFILKNAQAKDILANINSAMLKQHAPPDTDTTMIDAWETEIVTVFPGRLWVTGDPGTPDEDSTIRTEFENVYGVCVNRRVRFVSAGPDGQFGDYAAAAGTPLQLATLDNIHSYPLEAP